MADVILNSKFQLRNDIKSNWDSENPILLKGELGVEIDTQKFKFGNGIDTWSVLKYASAQSALLFARSPSVTDYSYDVGSLWINITTSKAYILYDNTANNANWKQIIHPEDLASLGGGDMLESKYATNAKSNLGYVDKAISSDALTTPRTITLGGDVKTFNADFDGSKNILFLVTLQDIISGVNEGTKPIVNDKGLVTGFNSLVESDIPNLKLSKITDAGTAAGKNFGNSAGQLVILNASGKIDPELLDSIAITDIFEVPSQSAMLALTAQQGDVAVRSDINRSFILKQSPATTLSNWVELKTPTDTVLSVNGETGVVTLTTSNILEGLNLYYTEARATANFNTNFPTKSSSELSDGNTILHSSDTLILNGGNSGGW